MSESSDSVSSHDLSRRGFVQRALYVAPAVLTLSAAASYAKAGSDHPDHPDHPTHPEHP
jgi:hypothetical protein